MIGFERWFFTTDYVDISLDNVQWYPLTDQNPEALNEISKNSYNQSKINITDINNENIETMVGNNPDLEDFYTNYDRFAVDTLSKIKYQDYLNSLSPEQLEIVKSGKHLYQLDFSNKGGLVMPLIIKFTYKNGNSEIMRIPAEIWAVDNYNISKVFVLDNEITSIELDPFQETADCYMENNSWPKKVVPTRFELYQYNRRQQPNPMQRQQNIDQMQK